MKETTKDYLVFIGFCVTFLSIIPFVLAMFGGLFCIVIGFAFLAVGGFLGAFFSDGTIEG